jgi:hypothetical protein
MPPSHTGITFSNNITYNKKFNFFTFPYIYNGGGVAVGDINNDGLPDLYFTGNKVSSRLYLNKGNFNFKDIAQSSGTLTHQWCTGAAMVDINHDGLLDIYVSVSGDTQSTPEQRANLLFINQGAGKDSIPHFEEEAAKYGLADTGFTTQTVFLDYDGDGDLDAFMINNDPTTFFRNSVVYNREKRNSKRSTNRDVLYRNNGDGTFTDVSRKAGIQKVGYSLGVVVCDFNRDGRPDIYISNDILSDDVLYINNGDGTFTDKEAEYLKHTSYAGMGTDAADFNNDGWPDLLQIAMRPPSLHDQHLVADTKGYQRFHLLSQNGYQYQYVTNSLQLSNGRDKWGNLKFSEISHLAGVAATNWSWSGLFADFNNDGRKDIMITNGYPKALTNHDYTREVGQTLRFGTDSAQQKQIYNIMDHLSGYKLPNYFFKNNGDLTFSDVSQKWGFTESTLSYGAAYADLDNDGDLDLIINNMDGKAGVYQNRADKQLHNHYLTVRLKGDSLNLRGIGAKVNISIEGKKQYARMQPYRGYESSVSQNIHFGLGQAGQVDTLEIYWPDGYFQRLTDIKVDTMITLSYDNSAPEISKNPQPLNDSREFTNVTDAWNIHYKHEENTYNDYKREPLLPHMLSRLGPGIAVGDVNNDGRADFYIGGAVGQPGRLYLQQKDGTFKPSPYQQAFIADKSFEDTAALFFDANGDGSLDLYVVSGGYGLSPLSSKLQDRLYLNNGKGRLVRDKAALPQMLTSGSCVKAGDYDSDGDLDLFVGGRVIPGKYPLSPRSYILQNNGHGIFKDVTKRAAPELKKGGMVTDALWIDFNGDGHLDLVTAGEWAPIRFYKNVDGKFKEVTKAMGFENTVGWWSSLAKGDFDSDGDMDIVAGNFGLNSRYAVKSPAKLEIFVADFDHNGISDAITAIHTKNGIYPIAGKPAMERQLTIVRRKFQTYEAYADATISDIVGAEALRKAQHYIVNTMASCYLENEGSGKFKISPLPTRSQFSSVNAIIPYDVNGDGNLDIIIAGNMYNINPNTTRNDAGNGLWLKGDGAGHFRAIPSIQSGFMAPGNVKDLEFIHTTCGTAILIGNNDDSLQAFKILDNK